MKRILLTLLLITLTFFAGAQDNLSTIRKAMADNKVCLDYSCTIPGKVTMKSSGSISVQRNCYKLVSAGIEIYCDGQTRWTVDRDAKEVLVEQAQGVAEFLDDSEKYLDSLEDLVLSKVKTYPFDKDDSEFIFVTENLGADWIVTDLR